MHQAVSKNDYKYRYLPHHLPRESSSPLNAVDGLYDYRCEKCNSEFDQKKTIKAAKSCHEVPTKHCKAFHSDIDPKLQQTQEYQLCCSICLIAMQSDALQLGAIRCNTVQCVAMRYNSLQFCTMTCN